MMDVRLLGNSFIATLLIYGSTTIMSTLMFSTLALSVNVGVLLIDGQVIKYI